VAAAVGVSDHTVAAAREDLESTAQIAPLGKTTGRDGKKRTTEPRQTRKNKAYAEAKAAQEANRTGKSVGPPRPPRGMGTGCACSPAS
jgi:hypothetical protein